MQVTRYRADGLIEWVLDVEAAEFYVYDVLDAYLRDHNDQGVRDDRAALISAIEAAKFMEDEED